MTIAIITFIILFSSSLGVFYLLKAWRRGRNGMAPARLKEKLREYTSAAPEEKRLSLLAEKRTLSDVPFLQALLSRLSWMPRLERLLQQADVQQSAGVVVLLVLILALAGFWLGSLAQTGMPLSVLAAVAMGYLPILALRVKKKRRVAAFQRQLPEALDLIGRALRAGHAFTSGMKLAAENFKDPLGQEFMKTVGEINFGSSVAEALKELALRVDCPDLRFFVVAVILQRETGGNLAEIIESMSGIIRERFAFEEKVQALTAEGKISAKITAGLVFGIIGMLYYINPAHFTPLLENPTGRLLALGSLASVLGGMVIMNRMTNSIKL